LFEQPSDPASQWPRHTVVTQFTTNSLDVADMDNDGMVDIILGEHRGTKKLSIWQNVDHGASFVEHIVDTEKKIIWVRGWQTWMATEIWRS